MLAKKDTVHFVAYIQRLSCFSIVNFEGDGYPTKARKSRASYHSNAFGGRDELFNCYAEFNEVSQATETNTSPAVWEDLHSGSYLRDAVGVTNKDSALNLLLVCMYGSV